MRILESRMSFILEYKIRWGRGGSVKYFFDSYLFYIVNKFIIFFS